MVPFKKLVGEKKKNLINPLIDDAKIIRPP